MQQNNLNIVVFDQNQSFVTQQSRLNYSTNRRPSTYDAYSSIPQQSVFTNQLTLISQKINALQQKAQKLSQLAKFSNKQNTMSQMNTTTNHTSVNSTQIQQLLRTIQIKIQVVVRETKKIIQKITGQFDKKIQKYTAQKNHENNSIAKIQAHCRDTISKIQQNYQQQINIVRNQHIHLQKRLIQRVQVLQTQYKKKLKDFQNKQQQYVATIEHLENKLKAANKNKKMIQVTQQKPQQKIIQKKQDKSHNISNKAFQKLPISSVKTDNFENMSNLSSQAGSSNLLPPNDTSKRRTKIFDTNRSVSPNNTNKQVLSPLKTNNIKQAQSTKNSVQQAMRVHQQKLIQTAGPKMNNYLTNNALPPRNDQQMHSNIPHIKATVIPYSNPSAKDLQPQYQLQAPPKLNPSQVHFSYRNSEKHSIMPIQNDATTKQFLKDVPKVQWQRFQDFNQYQNSQDSQQDVFFYPNNNRNCQKQQPKSVFDADHNLSNNSSMHSPFDLK